MANEKQYLRECKLYVYSRFLGPAVSGNGPQDNQIDLSNLKIKFAVKRSQSMTPNTADIRVYNLDPATANVIKTTSKQVLLQGGYESNFGVIFQGNIKQVIIGRESATDTFVDLVCGDGDFAYNYSVVNTTLAAGSTPEDQIAVAGQSMDQKGVTKGYVGPMEQQKLPRGKVMYGAASNYMKNVADSTNSSWSIQDQQFQFIPMKSFAPGERIVLTSKTGMIGTPEQTTDGVNVKCLLNPRIKVGSNVDIDNASIAQFKINIDVVGTPANTPAPLTADGSYYVLVVEHVGDTRGTEWYSNLICLNRDVTANPFNSVQTSYGV